MNGRHGNALQVTASAITTYMQEVMKDTERRRQLIESGEFPAYLAHITDYNEAVLRQIAPDAAHVNTLTQLFKLIHQHEWNQQLWRLCTCSPEKGAKVPKPRSAQKQKGKEDDAAPDDEDPIPEPPTHDRQAMYAGLEYLMMVKTKAVESRARAGTIWSASCHHACSIEDSYVTISCMSQCLTGSERWQCEIQNHFISTVWKKSQRPGPQCFTS
jgi:hypothetical protein